MALNVETKNRVLGPLAGEDVYNAGLALMVIGMSTVTKKNIQEAQARIDLVNAIDTKTWGKPSIHFGAKHLEGVWSNVSNETRAPWLKRIVGRFMDERAKLAVN